MSGREHGGGIDAACAHFGGARADWLDLSTGINPAPYPNTAFNTKALGHLPDAAAFAALRDAARQFWSVPPEAEVVVAGGASAIIAALPDVINAQTFCVQTPTYNEYEAAFADRGWEKVTTGEVQVLINPNNPDGRFAADEMSAVAQWRVIDESFCDPTPELSLIDHAATSGTVVIKSFGKFWGLAGLRLGFAICLPEFAKQLQERLGPWAVSAPALEIGTRALLDMHWASATRTYLAARGASLDRVLADAGCTPRGGTALFRLVHHARAAEIFEDLCRRHILVRKFSYAPDLLRFGLPAAETDLARLRTAMVGLS